MSAIGQAIRSERRSVADLTAGYAPLPGVPDEFIGPDGAPRAHWTRFFDALDHMEPDDIALRFANADRHIRISGVSYRAYGETSERDWPLSHLPLLISEREWADIAAGVEQRARLLEAVLGNVYGSGDLVSQGVLPAAVVTGSPDFLHPLVGLAPPGGRYLQLYAVDLGRGPDGRWWVLGDRTQAPSGSGYALASRLVLSRAFPSLYRDMNVQRLAPFFQSFRSGLASLAQRADPRICLMTPGPLSETYFEQSYLARYLGLLMVEGGDLTMRDGRVYIRTVDGLKRADVLWRRIDADFADPLELKSASRLGVPGLVEALRQGGVAIGNALGSGLLEAPALMSFYPRLARALLGETLLLPNLATWWCGHADERADVIAHLDSLAISGAFGNAVPGFAPGETVIGAALDAAQKARLIEAIEARGVDYVGQEVVSLSTTPAWEGGHIEPRPFVLRVFATATPEGWRVMPGGFCRISGAHDARAVSMGGGAQSADVWVLADTPVEMTTLLPSAEGGRIRRIMGNLPSRAADNLFWLGRYLERGEATLRLIRCLAGRLIDTDASGASAFAALLTGQLAAWGAIPRKHAGRSAVSLVALALHDADAYGSALRLVRDARRAASFIRERLSPDTWRLIGELEGGLAEGASGPISEAEAFEDADGALRTIAAISGLSQENMIRGAGWRFLDMGRRVERGANACRFARQFGARAASADQLDVLLDLADSQITYRSRYLTGVALDPVLDLVVLDAFNPRSVAFQVERLCEHLEAMPALANDGMLEAPRRLVLKLASEIATTTAAALDEPAVLLFQSELMDLAEAISDRYFLQGIHPAKVEKPSGLA